MVKVGIFRVSFLFQNRHRFVTRIAYCEPSLAAVSEEFSKLETMNTLDHLYEPHLTIREFTVLPGKEWLPGPSDWSLIQVEEGMGYWMQGQSSVDLETGTVLLISGDGRGHLRASQLNSMSLYSFSVTPARLTGLMTMREQDFLRQAASQTELAFQIFSPSSPVALKMRGLYASNSQDTLLSRLTLLQLYVEIFGKKLEQPEPPMENGNARERLRSFLMAASPDALAEMDFDDLARTTRCTSRHLSRIFYELMGMSFSDKRAEIRLGRARELLATSKSKVVEVAFESGYKSLSLFNQMFTRHFGISPGKWRQRHGLNRLSEGRRNGGSDLKIAKSNTIRPPHLPSRLRV
jgi:AraC-like DNA-binding protein